MPYEISFGDLVPSGIAMEAARGAGTVKVKVMEFVSEEDGDKLISRLEELGSDVLARLPRPAGLPPVQPSKVEQLLVIIRRDGTATVYLNELNVRGLIQPKRGFKSGEAVFADDIADVHRLEFDGISIPKDAGILFIFAVGWRRALFYDYAPLSKVNPTERSYDVNAQLGQLYSYLMFQARFKVTEKQWTNLFDGQWFPFITLKDATVKKLLAHADNAWPLDDLSDAIASEVKDLLPSLLAKWKTAQTFAEHLAFLEKAVEHYLNGDFLSPTAILYPRIEGILRSHQLTTDAGGSTSQKGLSASATKKAESERHDSTPLLPLKFKEYLEKVYFASFDPTHPKIKVSRHSVGHGVASPEEYSLKSASIGLLIVDQLYYCFSSPSQGTVISKAGLEGTD